MKISDFEENKKYIVTKINSFDLTRRLLDIGIIEGTLIEKVLSGDPAAYLYRGTVMAIRKEDAEQIEGSIYG